jgi:hypothetical protein
MEMGNKEQALETLAPIATTKKQKPIWSKKLELLVCKFCLLCVELNKPTKAKECLYNFKGISYVAKVFVCRFISLNRTQYPQSLEHVVKEFLDASERVIE